VGGRRHLSQTRTLRVFKEVGEALNSAATEQDAAGETLGRVAAPPARTRSPAMPFDSWLMARQDRLMLRGLSTNDVS
jgi:hypothetical protein